MRQELIENEGIVFIRVTNDEIIKDVNPLLNKIMNISNPPSPYFGRGDGGEGI